MTLFALKDVLILFTSCFKTADRWRFP